MAAHAEPMLHYLQRLLGQADADSCDDATLLQRFVSRRDETAFTALLARHGPMVLGVCRRVLRDDHEVEDAFQATFLLLARKAGHLRHPETLAAWLYGTAQHLARTTLRSNRRRRQRERENTAPVSALVNPLDELSARELLVILDEEMARLPERYRLPLILCGLEGRSQAEAARLLGWTADSLRGRLERGRARLRARLVRRGLTLGASLLTMESVAVSTVTAALRRATLQAATAFGRGECGGIAATVLRLTETGVANMTMAKAKIGLVLLLAMGLTAGASALVYSERTQQPPEAKKESMPPAAEKKVAVDRYGDPLPPGAATRLGSIRLRHGGHVMAVAFAPDGKKMVSGGFDGYAFLWDVATGKRLRAFRQDSIKSVAIDPKGKTVALAGFSDGTVKLYELATGKEAATIPGHRRGMEIVVFSPDGKLLATSGRGKSNTIRLWNVAKIREIHSWQADRVYGPSLRFTPDGKNLAYLDEDGALRLRDVATGAERPAPGPLASVRTLTFCFADEGKALVTGGSTKEGLLQLWDAVSGKEIRTIVRTKRGNTRVVPAPDGKSVWTDDGEGGLRQWDLADGKQLLHLPYSSRRADGLALSPDGKRLATGDREGNVYLWDTKKGQKTLDFEGHHSMVAAAVFTPDGRRVWTGGHDLTIRQWATASGEQLRSFSTERGKDHVYDLALRPDGKMLAMAVLRFTNNAATEKCDVRLWDLTTNKELEPLRGHGGWVNAVAFSPDGRTIASRSDDQTIRLWDVAAGKELRRLRCEWRLLRSLYFSPDGSRLISLLDKETIGFWDVETGRLTRRLSVGPSGRQPLSLLSRDGRIIICGGGEHPLRILEVASGAERCRIERPDAKGYAAATLSPDGRILAWCDYGQPIKLWDLIAGKQIGALGDRTNMADVLSLTFSPHSQRLASTHSDGTAVIWDAARLSPAAAAETKVSAQRLEELWSELASEDAAKAYRALRILATTPRQSIPLLGQRLAEAAKVKNDPAKTARLLADLDSAEFQVREKASDGLHDLAMSAGAAMRKTLRERPSLEVRRRLEQLLDKLESGARTTEQLRILRAVEVLESIGSAEVRQVLRKLAQEPGESWRRQETKAALARLAARSASKP